MRRAMLVVALATAAVGQMPCPALAREPVRASRPDAAAVEELARRAYVWGMPLVEAALIRQRFVQPQAPGNAVTINRFKHRRTLAGPEMRVGVGPNNDTIYSLAWVDLAGGPLIVSTPDFGNRYYTFSINFADSSAEQSLGQRTHGGQLPPLFLHGPSYKGRVPAGMVDVPSPTRYVNIAGRILVRSAAEYAEVHALQDKLAIHRWADWRKGLQGPAPAVPMRDIAIGPEGTPPALQFYYRLGSVLQDWVVRPQERGIVDELKPLGISMRNGFDPTGLPAASIAAITRGYDRAKEDVRQASLRLGVERSGWTTNYRGPRFGTDDLLRAAVAKDQIFVAVPEEAVYPIARVDADGSKLDGAHRYRIHFLPGQLPPVDAFWSITAYDDTGFMIPNPASRYSVGDRTQGLVVDKDGGVTVELSSTEPAAGSAANWLPVAPEAPFYLMMRLYRPRPEVLDRSWVPPAIERIGN